MKGSDNEKSCIFYTRNHRYNFIWPGSFWGMGAVHPIVVLWLALLWAAGIFLSKTMPWGGLPGMIPGACFIYMGTRETGQIFKETSLVMAGVLLTACSANTIQIGQGDIPLQSEMVQSEITQSSSGGQLDEDAKPEQNVTLYNSSSYTVFSNELIDTYFIACGLLFDFEGNYLFDSDMKVDYQQTIENRY